MEKRLSVRVFVVLLFTLAGVVHAQDPVYTGTCDISQISYTTTNAVSKTVVSTRFTDVPNTVVNFIVNVGGCAKIDFSTSIVSDSQEPLIFRVLFDTSTGVVIVPGEIRFSPTSEGSLFSASFILPLEDGLGAGNHNVRIEWRSPQPSTVLSSKTSVITYHN
jgi:hypothetical protein